MKLRDNLFLTAFISVSLVFAFACKKGEETEQLESQQKAKAEVTQEELSTAVPELRDLHEVVYPLWHSAFPEKDYELIKELLPQAESLTAKLDEAKLPGILRDKQSTWDQGKENLKASLKDLKNAVESDDQEMMLKHTEAFHAHFERLMRTIRPVVAELDAFHKEMYKLYHYYAPNYELEKIRNTILAMKEKLVPLQQVQLPKRLAERQADFEIAVKELVAAVDELAETVKADDKDAILKAVENAHTAYQKTEHIFD
ncbi:MAG: hypothetical protein JSV96_12245 [Candidatus Aminicenantes bacterium]|nr:MAG: hypothetical protein JSV96_12245 [Candidatus Aminicenantes bacterium]